MNPMITKFLGCSLAFYFQMNFRMIWSTWKKKILCDSDWNLTTFLDECRGNWNLYNIGSSHLQLQCVCQILFHMVFSCRVLKFILGHFEMFAAKVAFSTVLSNRLLLAYIKETTFHVIYFVIGLLTKLWDCLPAFHG